MIKKNYSFIIFFLFSNKLYADELIKTLSMHLKIIQNLMRKEQALNATKQDVNISRGEFFLQ